MNPERGIQTPERVTACYHYTTPAKASAYRVRWSRIAGPAERGKRPSRCKRDQLYNNIPRSNWLRAHPLKVALKGTVD